MLYEESLWFKQAIEKLVPPRSLVLNIGSSTKDFVETEQPYIKRNLFDVLTQKNCRLQNIDIRADEGVDLVGDVTEPAFIAKIRSMAPQVIICSNLLEHLEQRDAFCKGLVNMMSTSTLLFISVPYSFPYHEDPIDTMYRPDLAQLQSDLGNLGLVEGKIVSCGTYFAYSTKHLTTIKKVMLLIKLLLGYLPLYLTNKKKFVNLNWNFKNISATCAVFKLA